MNIRHVLVVVPGFNTLGPRQIVAIPINYRPALVQIITWPLNGRLATIWINDGIIHWRVYVPFSLEDLKCLWISSINSVKIYCNMNSLCSCTKIPMASSLCHSHKWITFSSFIQNCVKGHRTRKHCLWRRKCIHDYQSVTIKCLELWSW